MALKLEMKELLSVTRTARGTLLPNRLVKPDSDPANVVQCTANARALGVLQVNASSGDPVRVITLGIVPVVAGAALSTPGTLLVSDSTGRVVAKGSTGDQNVVGIQWSTTSAAGELVTVLLWPAGQYVGPTDGGVGDASFTIGGEAADVINVAVQLKDVFGADLAVRGSVDFYLSDDANGDSIASAAPDGGIAIGTDGLMIEWTANLAGKLTSESDGDIDINMTHAAGAKTVYLVLVLPNGKLKVSSAITFAA